MNQKIKENCKYWCIKTCADSFCSFAWVLQIRYIILCIILSTRINVKDLFCIPSYSPAIPEQSWQLHPECLEFHRGLHDLQRVGPGAARGERELAHGAAGCLHRAPIPLPHGDAGESRPSRLPEGQNDTPRTQCRESYALIIISSHQYLHRLFNLQPQRGVWSVVVYVQVIKFSVKRFILLNFVQMV